MAVVDGAPGRLQLHRGLLERSFVGVPQHHRRGALLDGVDGEQLPEAHGGPGDEDVGPPDGLHDVISLWARSRHRRASYCSPHRCTPPGSRRAGGRADQMLRTILTAGAACWVAVCWGPSRPVPIPRLRLPIPNVFANTPVNPGRSHRQRR